jgi:tRNA threonylcarbamoyladenosine biosynthesis protein TsaB
MAFILNIETATPLCSVALSRDGKILSLRETLEEKSHASKLTVFIEEMLLEENTSISDLDAVAVGKGPGSYTGLRIGVSTAKGLCYGANKPLIAVSTLHIMFKNAVAKSDDTLKHSSGRVLYCPMIDARRMEVFTCILDAQGNEVENVTAKIIDKDTFTTFLEENTMVFFGSGMEKCRDVLLHPNAVLIPDVHPVSSALAGLAEEAYSNQLFENIAYFEPFYLKDFVATVSKKGLHI